MSFPSQLIRKDLRDFHAYSSARHLAQEGSLFLDANENPYDPSGGEEWNRYPEPQPKELVSLLAELYSCRGEQLLVSRGSDEAIDILIRGFCNAGTDEVLVCPPTYGVYDFYAKLQGAAVKAVALNEEDFSYNIQNIKDSVTSQTKLIFLCTPNNPTGNLLALKDLEDLLKSFQSECLIVVDEAYIEFSQSESAVRLLDQYPNLAVLRTLSKAWGLAGLRCGSLIGHPELIGFLKKIIAPYPLPRPVYRAAIKALKQGRPSSLDLLIEERVKLIQEIRSFESVIQVYPSEANFILVKFKEAQRLFDHLKAQGIIIRSRAKDLPTLNCLRFTVGQPEENELLIREIKSWEQGRG